MRNLRFFLIPLFLFIPLAFLYAQTPKINSGLSAERLKYYERFIKSEIEHQKIPGAVTLVMHNGILAHKGAYGYSNSITKTPMKTDDIFNIKSMERCQRTLFHGTRLYEFLPDALEQGNVQRQTIAK